MNCSIFSPEAEIGVNSRGKQSASTTEEVDKVEEEEEEKEKSIADADKNDIGVGKGCRISAGSNYVTVPTSQRTRLKSKRGEKRFQRALNQNNCFLSCSCSNYEYITKQQSLFHLCSLVRIMTSITQVS